MKWLSIRTDAIVLIFSLLVSFFARKIHFEKGNAAELYGEIEGTLFLSADSISFSGNRVLTSELRNIKIIARDYSGKRRLLFWRSLGVRNLLMFEFKNRKYSFQFLIKEEKDFKTIKNIKSILEPKSKLTSTRYLK